MKVRAIRQALADAFTIHGFRSYDTLPESGDLPLVAISWPDAIRYNQTLTAGVQVDFVATVAVAVNDFSEAQVDIDDVLSTPGLADKLATYESTEWWEAVVLAAENIRTVNVGGAQALAVDFIIQLTTRD